MFYVHVVFLCNKYLVISFYISESDFEYPVKLFGGQKASEGTVEVYSNSQHKWGMVCDFGWGTAEANVVCRMLGFEGQSDHLI